MLIPVMAEQQEQVPRVIDVMVLGAGRMGSVHIRAMREISQRYLEPVFNISLRLSAVERDPQKWAALPDDVAVFADLEQALQEAPRPEIAMLAFNDDQHAEALHTLFDRHPDIQAVFSEKPLTETLAEAQGLLDDLSRRYLSMNTVINFSPVLNDDAPPGLPPDAQLIGFEAVWGKDRTADTRPSIGVPSESVHAISLITDMFGQRNLALKHGHAVVGDLTANARDVIYDMQAVFEGESDLPVRFDTSYVLDSQHRRVTAYYESAGYVYAAEYSFDVKGADGRVTDLCHVYQIDEDEGLISPVGGVAPQPIAMGNGQNQLTNDRVTAYNLLSLIDYLGIADKPTEAMISKRLISLDAVMAIQGEIEQINVGNALLGLTRRDTSPDHLRPPLYKALAETTGAEIKARLAGLRSDSQHVAAVPKPGGFKPR